jgi:tRNA1Val (adenine37-N6)-methyltransferase
MDLFKFKQFDVDQTGCAMKVNTDGVLLGALAGAGQPENILDIGTGTGVIALMLAQRFEHAHIDAVEIDQAAAEAAGRNFKVSKFAEKMALFPIGFEHYFESHPDTKYDLIVSNPPFFLNSLESPGAKKNLARHTDEHFFESLVKVVSKHLTNTGICAMILPLNTANYVKVSLPEVGLYLQEIVSIRSFTHTEPHREIITIGRNLQLADEEDLVIYAEPKVYSAAYQHTLKDFLTIF